MLGCNAPWLARTGIASVPVADQGRTYYDIAEIARAWAEHREGIGAKRRASGADAKTPMNELRAENLRLDNELKALKLSRERGEVVSADDLKEEIGRAMSTFAIRLSQIPLRLRAQHVDDEVVDAVQSKLNEAMGELSSISEEPVRLDS